jgi:cytosine/adenosine deaminase-related metal-dependent hydrolase
VRVRRLIRNAFVVSVDPAIGNIDGCDILIDGGRIVEVRPGIAADADELFDAAGHIVSPGFVDTHHHIWQSAIRGITAEWSLRDYIAGIRLFIATAYRPEDMYAAQLGGALQALHWGVTTTADYCHNLNSPDHVEESIRGTHESGARVLWCYGFNRPPLPEPAFASLDARADYLRATAARHFAGREQLVTLGVSPEEAWFWPDIEHGRRQFAEARALGARIAWHANSSRDIFDGRPRRDAGRAIEAGLIGADTLLVHMNQTEPDEWQGVADLGAHVSITPETELQMDMGWPIAGTARRHGVNVSLGIDILSNNSADLRFQLRLLLQNTRFSEQAERAGMMSAGLCVQAAEALYWGTMGGARALGLEDRIGSITPGKRADLLFHDTRPITLAAWDRTQPESTLLMQAGVSDLTGVMVDGKWVKRDGRLTADERRAADLLTRTNDRLREEFDRQGGVAAALGKQLEQSRAPQSNDGRGVMIY